MDWCYELPGLKYYTKYCLCYSAVYMNTHDMTEGYFNLYDLRVCRTFVYFIALH